MRILKTLTIGNNFFVPNEYGEYYIPIDQLGDLKLTDLPSHSRVHVTGISSDGVDFQFSASHQDDEDGVFDYISFMVAFKSRSIPERTRRINHIKKHFASLPGSWELLEMQLRMKKLEHGLGYVLREQYIKPSKSIKAHLSSALRVVSTYSNHLTKAFLCHSSEDKALVEQFAAGLRKKGADVWFDKWEIRTGDSIVEKVDEGLDRMTHLILFLSATSISKPWVKKELSSGLMRKLSNNSVKVVPILLDKVKLPTIIADIKYADCTNNPASGFKQAIGDLLD